MEMRLTNVYSESRFSSLRDLIQYALRRSMRVEKQKGKLDEEICATLSQICFQAVSAGLRAEHLVILIKKTWKELPGRPRGDIMDGNEVLARIISACIREYYNSNGANTACEGSSKEVRA